MVAKNLINDVLSLPASERLELVRQVWDSLLDDPDGLPLSDEQKRELDRRYDDFVRNPSDSYTWEEVEAFVRARLRS